MNDPFFDFISRYFWALALALGAINAIIIYGRTESYRQKDPTLVPGYKMLIRWYFILSNIPWVIMGWGIMSGRVASIWTYLHPRRGGFFTESFFFSIVSLWLLFGYWIYFAGGAETLSKYPGVFRVQLRSVRTIKLYCGIYMLVGVVVFPLLWVNGLPVVK